MGFTDVGALAEDYRACSSLMTMHNNASSLLSTSTLKLSVFKLRNQAFSLGHMQYLGHCISHFLVTVNPLVLALLSEMNVNLLGHATRS